MSDADGALTEFDDAERRLMLRALRLAVSSPRRMKTEAIPPTMTLLTRLRSEWGIAPGDEDQ